MDSSKSLNPENVLRGYFHAKDENRPHLLRNVFAADAQLVIINASSNIAFPAVTSGRDAIAQVLVGTFCIAYENVYSFYRSRPPIQAERFSCDWLVGMSEKASGQGRVGCGRYDWEFQSQPSGLARRLVIDIAAMQVLAAGEFERVLGWLGALDYPWDSAASALRAMPPLESLSPVANYLGGSRDVT